MSARLICLLLSAGLCCGAHAGDVYKWTDDKGKTHYGDPPTGQAKERATKLERKQMQLTVQQLEDAQIRAARSKQALVPHVGPWQPEPRSASADAAGDQLATPTVAVDPDTECAQQIAEYQRNGECFNRYRVVGGGIRGDAFRHCNETKRPACYQPERQSPSSNPGRSTTSPSSSPDRTTTSHSSSPGRTTTSPNSSPSRTATSPGSSSEL